MTEVAGVDESQQKVYFVSTETSPFDRELYSVKLNGKDRTRISHEPGTHEISMSPTAEYYLDTFSSLDGTAAQRRRIPSPARNGLAFARPITADADEYAIQPAEIVQIKAQDGKLLYGRLIKPANFRAGEKYPAVVMVYGGPGAQSVVNAWEGAELDARSWRRGAS